MTVPIETEKLTKSYGPNRGIVDLDLEVDEGEVFGFLGPNGAGKTTTIRTLLDHLRPTSGRARVFGIETTADPVAIHRRTGYLPGEFTLYDRLTGGQTIEYFGNLRGGVDPAYRASLVERLDLDPSRRFTVFLSSHVLSEVERTCDRVAIVRDGRLVRTGRVDTLRDLAHHQVELRFPDGVPTAEFAALPGVSDVVVEDHTLRLRVAGPITPVLQVAARHELVDFLSREPSLVETFLAEYGRQATEVSSR